MANYLLVNKHATADGPGVRVSVYLAGCPLRCPGCHNASSWDFKAGKLFESDTQAEVLTACDSDYIAGLSILGGEPLANENLATTQTLTREFKSRFPNKNLWLWTGYEWNELIDRANSSSVLTSILITVDVIVVGRFNLAERDITKENLWRGSRNQRVIKCKESLCAGKICYLEDIINNN